MYADYFGAKDARGYQQENFWDSRDRNRYGGKRYIKDYRDESQSPSIHAYIPKYQKPIKQKQRTFKEPLKSSPPLPPNQNRPTLAPKNP